MFGCADHFLQEVNVMLTHSCFAKRTMLWEHTMLIGIANSEEWTTESRSNFPLESSWSPGSTQFLSFSVSF